MLCGPCALPLLPVPFLAFVPVPHPQVGDLRAAASAKSHSASPRKWKGKSSCGTSSHPTEGESSSGIPASPSSARKGKPASEAEDEDAESLPSHPSQVEGDEDAPGTDPAVYTLKDVKDEELDMSACVVTRFASLETLASIDSCASMV
eukprot:s846_g33.t1